MKFRWMKLGVVAVPLLCSGTAALAQSASPERSNAGQDKFKSESTRQREQLASYADDSWITTKVKAALVKEMKTLDVSVETYRGQVLLSGFVDSQAERKKALQVASSVQGVAGVKDGLIVKK